MNNSDSIEDQVIFIFNNHKKIKNIYFLTYKDTINQNSFVYNTYLYLKNNQPRGFENDVPISIIKNHILLTLNLNQVRGYLKHILNIEENIIVFSLWNNIDYEYHSKEIFNPFNIKKDSIIKKVQDTTILYEIYNNVAKGGVFCIISDNDIESSDILKLTSSGIYDEKIFYYVNNIMLNLNKYHFELHSEKKENNDYISNIKYKHYYIFLKLLNYKKTISWVEKNNIFISGDCLTILNNDDSNISKRMICNDIDGNNIFYSLNNSLVINNEEEFNTIIIKNKQLLDLDIKKKKHKFLIIIYFNSNLPGNIIIDYDFIFFIEETKKTRNIFLDPTKKINIITSKNHISFRSSIFYPKLAEYMTLILLGYISINQQLENLQQIVKIENRYFSRYCQNAKNIIRKPVVISMDDNILSNTEYLQINSKYYKGKYDDNISFLKKGSKHKYQKFRYGDIYYDEVNNLYFKCIGKDYPYLGFIEEVLKGFNICLPCCYSKPRDTSLTFKECIFNEKNNESYYNPFLIRYGNYRVILDKYKFGELSKTLNDILNFSKNININKSNRIISADEYSVYTSYKNIIITDNNDIFKFIYSIPNSILIFGNKILYPSNILENNIVNNVFLLIQNRIHIIKDITKKENSFIIESNDINNNKKERLLGLLKNINKLNFKVENNNLVFKNNFLYIDGEKYDKKIKSRYLIKFNNINLEENNISNFITNTYCSKYFSYIFTDNLDLYKKIWITNILQYLKEDNILLYNANLEKIKKKIDNLFVYSKKYFQESNSLSLS